MYMYVPEIQWIKPPHNHYRAAWLDFSDSDWSHTNHSKWFDSEFEADLFIKKVKGLYPTCTFWIEFKEENK